MRLALIGSASALAELSRYQRVGVIISVAAACGADGSNCESHTPRPSASTWSSLSVSPSRLLAGIPENVLLNS